MGILANENAIESGGYVINNSLRFQSASSQYLARTPASASNRKTWTWSGWVKRGSLATGSAQILFSTGPTGAGQTWNQYHFDPDNTLRVINFVAGTQTFGRQSTPLYRDPSAWYHVVILFDTTQATDTNRLKFYVNGSEIVTTTSSSYASYPTLNLDGTVNNTVVHGVGGIASNSYLDGYLTEVNFVDGQALTPSSFGQTNSLTGQWVAVKYTGTYGTNGFYLPFSNGTSTTTLGADSSGNSNNWTLTNFTRSAGVSDCFMFDVPSGNGSGTGTQPSSNYAVISPLQNSAGYATVANGNLFGAVSTAVDKMIIGSMGFPQTGKYYFEWAISAVGNATVVGLTTNTIVQSSGTSFSNAGGLRTYQQNGNKYDGTTSSAFGSSFTTSDVIGVAVDMDNGAIYFAKNNTWQNSGVPTSGASKTGAAFTNLSGIEFFFGCYLNAASGNLNHGQRSFTYTPPTGFKALCTANLPASTIVQGNKYMDATTYTGNGSTQTITNAGGFQPDFVWLKARSGLNNHYQVDAVRGGSGSTMYTLFSSTTDAEQTTTSSTNLTYGVIQALTTTGFTVAAGTTNAGATNFLSNPYVAWQWKAGNGTSSNTNGTITSTTSVGATQGFSIVTWTGNGTTGATIGHGLGVAPKMIIAKTRGIVQNWVVYRPEIGNSNVLLLNSSSAAFADGAWNSTTPTSSVFTVNNGQGVNQASATYVAYCFAEIAGFSKFGSYTGNGSADGTFVYTGFRPKFVMIKSSTAVDDWRMYDASRPSYNVIGGTLLADTAGAETTAAEIDFTSNGFKLRITTTPNAAQTYIYAAFASNPFAQSNAV